MTTLRLGKVPKMSMVECVLCQTQSVSNSLHVRNANWMQLFVLNLLCDPMAWDQLGDPLRLRLDPNLVTNLVDCIAAAVQNEDVKRTLQEGLQR